MAPAASVASPRGYRRTRFAGASTGPLPQNQPRRVGLLRASQRPSPGRRTHARSNQYLYSTISSARPLKGSGTVMPSALASWKCRLLFGELPPPLSERLSF